MQNPLAGSCIKHIIHLQEIKSTIINILLLAKASGVGSEKYSSTKQWQSEIENDKPYKIVKC